MNPEDARAEQLRLARELRSSFQKSGTFMANSSGQSRTRSQASRSNQPGRQPPPAHHPSPSQVPRYNPSVNQPRNPNLAKAGFATQQAPVTDNRKRKMENQAADFFAERPNTAQERGPGVQYYQGENRAAASTTSARFAVPAMTTGFASPNSTYSASAMSSNYTTPTTVFSSASMGTNASNTTTSYNAPLSSLNAQNSKMGQVNAAPANTLAKLPVQATIPGGPVVWHYQDNNDQPQPLARDENMMEVDMPDATAAATAHTGSQFLACTCTGTGPSGGASARGLTSSRWAASNMKVDECCPQHGTQIHAASSFWTNSSNTDTQTASQSVPKPTPFVGYYQ